MNYLPSDPAYFNEDCRISILHITCMLIPEKNHVIQHSCKWDCPNDLTNTKIPQVAKVETAEVEGE